MVWADGAPHGGLTRMKARMGFVDAVDGQRLTGWAREDGGPVTIHVLEGGAVVASGWTGLPREDFGDLSGFP